MFAIDLSAEVPLVTPVVLDHASLVVFVSGCPVLDQINFVANCDFSRCFCSGFLLCIVHTFLCSDTTTQWPSVLECVQGFAALVVLQCLRDEQEPQDSV